MTSVGYPIVQKPKIRADPKKSATDFSTASWCIGKVALFDAWFVTCLFDLTNIEWEQRKSIIKNSNNQSLNTSEQQRTKPDEADKKVLINADICRIIIQIINEIRDWGGIAHCPHVQHAPTVYSIAFLRKMNSDTTKPPCDSDVRGRSWMQLVWLISDCSDYSCPMGTFTVQVFRYI